MAKLPAVYVFNKRQLGILSPEKILYPFYLNIRDWLCFLKTTMNPSLPTSASGTGLSVAPELRIGFDPGRLVLIRRIVI